MSVRNFWIETQVDGHGGIPATGPKAADGGFTSKFWIRKGGEHAAVLRLEGMTTHNGDVELYVIPSEGTEIERLDHGGFVIRSKR
jgi:hypothetical protein